MASSRRPVKPRRRAPKTAEAHPATGQPSTPKPRAQGKLGPVSNKPATLERPSRSEIQLVRKVRRLEASLEMARQDRERRLADCEVEIASLRKEVATLVGEARRLMAISETIQLACKRLRSALGPLGQGTDDRSTTGHMLAMIEQLIEQHNFAGNFERVAHESIIRMRSALGEIVRADVGSRQVIPDDLAAITGRMIEALKQAALSEPIAALRSMMDRLEINYQPSDELGAKKWDGLHSIMLAGAGSDCDLHPKPAASNVVQWRPPQPADAATSELEPGMHDSPCEDLDGSGACFGCGRWLGDDASTDVSTENVALPKDPTGGSS